MSLEAAAETVADQIRRQQFVDVYAHHDADGIAAGAILCHAMLRAGIRFRPRICAEVTLQICLETGHNSCAILGPARRPSR